VSCDFLASLDGLDDAESNKLALAKKFAVVVAVVLSGKLSASRRSRGWTTRAMAATAHIHKPRGAEEQMIALHLTRVDNRKIVANAIAVVSTLEHCILLVGKVRDGAGEVHEIRSWSEMARREHAKLGLARLVRVALGMGNLDIA
jgi:hypothetical protein